MRVIRISVVLAFTLLAGCSGSDRAGEGYLETGEHTLYYRTIGSGEPIVVLHGGPGFDHQQFLPYLEGLADKHQVIFFDQRGTGLSSGPVDSASITLDAFIADIETVREAFDLQTMNLLGHSWGGILAMHYAVRHPDRLKTLTICSAGASADCFETMRAEIQRRRPAEDTELLETIYASAEFQAQDPAAIERFWRVYFRVYFADTSWASSMNLAMTENTIRNGNAVAGHILGSVGEFDLHADLKKVTCPTLVVHGDADPMPVSYARRIHESVPGSRLRVLEGSGHWIFVDAAEPFCAAVTEFLAESP